MLKFKPKEKIQITDHFDTTELDCGCGKCTENYIDKELIEILEEVRVAFKEPIKITSGYRCPAHNAAIGGAPGSSHMSGLAVDIKPLDCTKEKLDKLYALCYTKFNNIGDGRPKGFVHVDVRPAKSTGKRTWIY